MSFGQDGIYHPDPHRRWQNRRIRGSDLAGLRARLMAAEVSAQIAARERAAQAQADLDARVAAVKRRKDLAIEAVAESSLALKDSWLAQLDAVSATDPTAVDQLTTIRREADRVGHWMNVLAGLRADMATPLDSTPASSPPRRPTAGDLTDDPLLAMRADGPGERYRRAAVHAERISAALAALIDALGETT